MFTDNLLALIHSENLNNSTFRNLARSFTSCPEINALVSSANKINENIDETLDISLI